MAGSDYFIKCAPLMRQDFDSCGGLTNCNLSPTTADELDQIYKDSQGRWRIMGALIENDMMGKACQAKQNPFYEFIIANAKAWGKANLGRSQRIGSGLIEVEPFLKVGRKGLINNAYWKWTKTGNSGTAANGQSYDIVGNATSTASIPGDGNWFGDKMEVQISGLSGGGSRTQTQWLVVHRATQANGIVQLFLRSRNGSSRLAGYKLETPSTGVLFRGVPNVNPAESFCQQPPRLNTNSQYLAWISDTRWSMCEDDNVKKFKQNLYEGNPLYRQFFAVESAEYMKQLTTDFQNRLVNTFLFSKPLPNQTENLWPNLETIGAFDDQNQGDYIYLPGIEGKCVGRRASVVGVYEQLAECNRVLDCQGQRINLPELFTYLYDMQRVRKDNGLDGSVIEIVVDSAYRVSFIQGLFRYLKARYEGTMHAVFDITKNEKVSPQLGFVWQDFPLDWPMVTLRVVSHYAFDDFVSAHTAVSSSLTIAGRFAWIFDWNTIYMSIIESETLEIRTADNKTIGAINSDAFCRMRIPQRSIKHYAMKWCVVVDCPSANLWLENFTAEVPEHEAAVGATDGYGNLTTND